MSTPPPPPPPPLTQNASLFSLLTFSWVSPLITFGYRNELSEENLNSLLEIDHPKYLSSLFEKAWSKEQAAHPNSAHLSRALFNALGTRYFLSGLLALLETVFKVGEAVSLGYLVQWFQSAATPAPRPLSEAYIAATAMTLFALSHACTHHHYFFPTMRVGTMVKMGMTAFVYKKALRLPLASTATAGAVINLVSNDLQSFELAGPFFHYIWVAPIELLIATYFLYQQIGWACFTGLASFLLVFPVQGFFARKFTACRDRTVRHRDERVRTLSDLLNGIALVKLYAWEQPLGATVERLRSIELKSLREATILKALNDSVFFLFPAFISYVTFMTFYAAGRKLETAQVYTSIALFNMLRLTLTNFFPKAVETVSEARVSLRRIQAFLSLPELSSDVSKYELPMDSNYVVEFENATFAWTASALSSFEGKVIGDGSKKKSVQSDEKQNKLGDDGYELSPLPAEQVGNGIDGAKSAQSTGNVLRDISLAIHNTELLAVVGKVGSGKTSLCMAMLGEMEIRKGELRVGYADGAQDAREVGEVGVSTRRKPRFAYASQSPWILAGTVRDNILFGNEFDEERYSAVITACALQRDMELWPQGEWTMIGERGVNVSGGQRARIGLARAAYTKDVDIYIFDDPLSAVDSRVGRRLFRDCISTFLADKPRVLITHQLQYARECESIAVLDKGTIVAQGRVSDVVDGEMGEEKGGFGALLKEFLTAEFDEPESQENISGIGPAAVGNRSPQMEEEEDDDPNDASPNMENAGGGIKTELRQSGMVKFNAYWTYLRSGSSFFRAIGVLSLIVIAQVSSVSVDFWLSRWSSGTFEEQRKSIYPILFSVFVGSTILFAFSRTLSVYMTLLNSSRNIFREMLGCILAAPITFFNVNPHGRVLNRFAKDQSVADELLPWLMQDGIVCMLQSIAAVIVVCVNAPFILVSIPFLAMAYTLYRRFYMRTSRQIKRIESTTRSPIYSLLSETLDGLSTVRAYDVSNRFLDLFTGFVTDNARAYFLFLGSARWLGFRLDMIAAGFLGISIFVIVATHESQTPAMVGLSLSYVLQLIGLVQWAVRQSIEIEINMISVERMLEYTKVESEAPPLTDLRPPPNWPDRGVVEFRGLTLVYPGGDDAKPVLKSIDLKVNPHEKVGIVGRTGAGKSSMLSALFRMIEPTPAGCVVIDGVDVSKLGLADLRKRISIIPQEPFLFKGTVRMNLDPFGEHTDLDLWNALEHSELKGTVEKMEGGLDAPVTESGTNLSVGERQLVCLARVVLRKTVIVVLDEATANVDLHTDRLIQSSVRTQFRDATVLTIAHRLDTVMTYDKILVLDAGRVAEYGPAHELLQRPNGLFTRMVRDTGAESDRLLRQIALERYNETD